MYFIICGHGEFADGILSGATLLCGDIPACRAVNFRADSTPETLRAALNAAVADAGGQALLFFTDILGGTPFRECALIAGNLPAAEVISGSNLQILVEAAIEREEAEDPQRFAKELIERARAGMSSLSLENARRSETPNTPPAEEDGI